MDSWGPAFCHVTSEWPRAFRYFCSKQTAYVSVVSEPPTLPPNGGGKNVGDPVLSNEHVPGSAHTQSSSTPPPPLFLLPQLSFFFFEALCCLTSFCTSVWVYLFSRCVRLLLSLIASLHVSTVFHFCRFKKHRILRIHSHVCCSCPKDEFSKGFGMTFLCPSMRKICFVLPQPVCFSQ